MARKQRKNSRRTNGEGSIVQRKDSRWCGAVLLGYKPDGKLNRKSVYCHSQTEVLEKMSEIKHRLVTGPKVSSTNALVGDTMKLWLRIFKNQLFHLAHLKVILEHLKITFFQRLEI